MSKRKTTEEFIADAIKKHGNKYDYSCVEYKGATAFVTIICPIHGKFQQRAADHINSHGCKNVFMSKKQCLMPLTLTLVIEILKS